MRKLLTGFIDMLFPPSANALRIRNLSSNQWKTTYQPGRYHTCTYLSHYQQPLVQAVLKENKFHHNTQAATALATLLLTWPPTHHVDTVFIPIPLGYKRQRDRGHNQVVTVLRTAGLLERTNQNILERSHETLPQSHLHGAQRSKNITNAFICHPENISALQTYSRIILFDDVVTTGATLEAAKKVLLPHIPAHMTVTCLALAH